MKTSIVITTFNRAALLNNTLISIVRQNYPGLEIIVVDDGTDSLTPQVCQHYPVQYIKTPRRATTEYSNPSRPNNIGIRRSKGEVVIIQNAECMHMDFDTIARLSAMVTDRNVVFAKVQAVSMRGTPVMWYCSKEERPVPYFFCGAIKRSWLEKLRGFDEDYTLAGYDDNDMGDRLAKEGLEFVFSDILVHHQWHPPAGTIDWEPMKALYEQKTAAMAADLIGTIRNLNREWGAL